MSGIVDIREKLAAVLLDLEGVRQVYANLPNEIPSNLPAFVLEMRDPCLTTSSNVNSERLYAWHFDVTFLYTSEGQGTVDENLSGLEEFMTLFDDALCANIMPTDGAGGTVWDGWNKDDATLEFTAGILALPNAPENTRYWGWHVSLDVYKRKETAMAAG